MGNLEVKNYYTGFCVEPKISYYRVKSIGKKTENPFKTNSRTPPPPLPDYLTYGSKIQPPTILVDHFLFTNNHFLPTTPDPMYGLSFNLWTVHHGRGCKLLIPKILPSLGLTYETYLWLVHRLIDHLVEP